MGISANFQPPTPNSQPVHLKFDGGVIRSWTKGDAPALARHANDRAIWRNLKDRFPNPYTLVDAEWFISHCLTEDPESTFAITVDDDVIGAIGFEHRGDIWRRSVELGYWIAPAYWGRGIMTGAVRSMTNWAFDTWTINRVWAGVFSWNPASARVLEKAGYVYEGRLRQSAVKDGEQVDELIYAVVR
jgi:RimJ/RimL family protein N-acetyltransferase